MTTDRESSRYLTSTRATVHLVLFTILACVVATIGVAVQSYRYTVKAEQAQRAAERSAVQADEARRVAEQDRDRALVQVDELTFEARCRSFVETSISVVELDLLDVLAGALEADLRGLSKGPLADQTADVRKRLFEARRTAPERLAGCTG